MAKPVPVTPSESQAITSNASKTYEVTDSRGRVIVLRKPLFSETMDLLVVVGPEASKNDLYMSQLTALLYVSSIDGTPTLPLSNKKRIDDLLNELEGDGLDAVNTGVVTHFVRTFSAEEVKKKSDS